jgi:hypothetical protein
MGLLCLRTATPGVHGREQTVLGPPAVRPQFRTARADRILLACRRIGANRDTFK